LGNENTGLKNIFLSGNKAQKKLSDYPEVARNQFCQTTLELKLKPH
jgi:hypothetical protein